MKKLLFLILSLILCFSIVGCGTVSEEVKSLITKKCDDFVKNYDYSDTVLYTVESISYTINDLKKNSGDEYFVDITWKITISDSCIYEHAWQEDWLKYVDHILSSETFVNPKNGKSFRITHTKEDYEDSVRVSVNGKSAYSGLDDFKENVGDPDEIKNSVKCKSCGIRYQKGSDNARSISRTNMCKKCYDSYKSVSDALKEFPLY